MASLETLSPDNASEKKDREKERKEEMLLQPSLEAMEKGDATPKQIKIVMTEFSRNTEYREKLISSGFGNHMKVILEKDRSNVELLKIILSIPTSTYSIPAINDILPMAFKKVLSPFFRILATPPKSGTGVANLRVDSPAIAWSIASKAFKATEAFAESNGSVDISNTSAIFSSWCDVISVCLCIIKEAINGEEKSLKILPNSLTALFSCLDPSSPDLGKYFCESKGIHYCLLLLESSNSEIHCGLTISILRRLTSYKDSASFSKILAFCRCASPLSDAIRYGKISSESDIINCLEILEDIAKYQGKSPEFQHNTLLLTIVDVINYWEREKEKEKEKETSNISFGKSATISACKILIEICRSSGVPTPLRRMGAPTPLSKIIFNKEAEPELIQIVAVLAEILGRDERFRLELKSAKVDSELEILAKTHPFPDDLQKAITSLRIPVPDILVKSVLEEARAISNLSLDGAQISRTSKDHMSFEEQITALMHMRGLETKRKQLALEMITTEESYVSSLNICIEQYLSKLKSEAPSLGLSEDTVNTLFCNLPLLAACNQKLMKALLPLKNFDPETTKIGQHFISFFDENTQELYAQYIVGYGKALACYGDLMKKDEKFRKLSNEMTVNPEVGNKSLDAFLVMPIQRFPRYVMLLHAYLENLQKTHSDFESVTQALSLSKSFTAKLNEAKRTSESEEAFERLKITVSEVPKWFSLSQRKCFRDVTVNGFKQSKMLVFGGKPVATTYHLFVLNDSILIVHEKETLSIIKQILPLNSVIPRSGNQSLVTGISRFGFPIVMQWVRESGTGEEVFGLRSTSERDEFLNFLKTRIANAVKDKKESEKLKVWEGED
eukprot:TRINITY_DN25668_c0_g1_i1.p1 TRINITY_DN25668_c0_g1~~TRINITY_DN25668_c0_g1_i1.p1  ORF type:complete len:881 (+),score=236.52 TRINITY_DN25668_c0_g1_i1:111-2645(+)